MENNEIWRPVAGYEGLYEVSSLGRVRSIERIRKSCYNTTCTINQKILKAHPSKTCVYLRVTLSNNKETKRFLVHRLVARAFPEICGEWFEGCVINHKDENPTNNAATNIEVCTQVYNCNYGAHNEKLSKSLTKNAVYQLTLNGQFVKKFDNACSAARNLGVHFQNIYKALNGEIPSAYGFKWQYA